MPSVDLTVRVTPKSSRNRIEWGETVKVWVTAPPVDGAANDAVRELLAKALGVPKSQLDLIRGQTSREKTFRIEGVDAAELQRRREQPKLLE
ncbi:MAG: DUF167 domain-containing protein [Fimbriimonadales bacterium]